MSTVIEPIKLASMLRQEQLGPQMTRIAPDILRADPELGCAIVNERCIENRCPLDPASVFAADLRGWRLVDPNRRLRPSARRHDRNSPGGSNTFEEHPLAKLPGLAQHSTHSDRRHLNCRGLVS